ncbi:hypothetical protein ACXR6G_03910 [Ancylomarina sp. YFZ004]
MKKLLFIALISLLCFACKDDPQELFIKTTEVSLYPEDVIQIDAVSDFDITYLSTNIYLADVSAEGMLTANKVGKTLVEVTSHDRVVEVPVEVMGRYNVYPDPITDWALSQSDLIKIAGEPDKSYTSSIEYANYSDQAPAIAYLFTPGDSLMCAMVIVIETASDDLVSYMNERFVFDSDEDGLLVYCNAHKQEDVSMLIGIFYGSGGSPMVLYMEYQQPETKSSQAVATDFNNLRTQMKVIASENMNKLD